MTDSPAVAERIEQEIEALTPRQYLRSGYSFAQFSADYSRLLGRARKERVALEAAGFDIGELVYYDALLDAHSLAQAARLNAAADFAQAKRRFMDARPEAVQRYYILSAAARYIISRDPTPELHRTFSETRKGKSMLAILNNTLTLIALLRRRPDLTANVRPAGIPMDEQHLTEIESATLALLRQNGDAKVAANLVSEAVDRRARIMTLCIRAVRELKLFAKIAFVNDRDRYRKEWASPSTHRPFSKQSYGFS